MRRVACPCGVVLHGEDDEELFRLGRAHAAAEHADVVVSDDYIRGYIRENARDEPAPNGRET